MSSGRPFLQTDVSAVGEECSCCPPAAKKQDNSLPSKKGTRENLARLQWLKQHSRLFPSPAVPPCSFLSTSVVVGKESVAVDLNGFNPSLPEACVLQAKNGLRFWAEVRQGLAATVFSAENTFDDSIFF